jgi:hypothetical protein
MSVPLKLGDYELNLAIYTTEPTYYEPQEWRADGDSFHCARLLYGDTGEKRAATDSSVTVRSLPAGHGRIRLQISCRHERAVKGIKLTLNVPYMPMLAPEKIDLVEATWRQWDFPRDWRTGFAVWEHDGADAAGRYFTVVTKETPWRFRRIRALRMGDRMRLEIVQDAALRQRTRRFESSVWEIGYHTEIDSLLDDYARFVMQAFGAQDFARRQDMPAWTRQVGLAVNLHGADWNGHVHLDFAGMTRVCEMLAQHFPATQTLLYPIGWDGPYMRRYPDFQPGEALGGHEGFRAFCSRARGLGFHVMPHLNAMAVNMQHPLYLQHLKDYVIRDWNGIQRHSYTIDWDYDGQGDPAHAYIALEPPALREILVERIGALVRDYGIDAVFLDETCNVFYNDPAWDQVEGVRRLVRELHERYPELLIAGEEWNETLLGLTPVVQIWEETQDGRKAFGREKSPLMRTWGGRFIRALGYLALASPDGRTGVHEWPDVPWVDERQNEAFYVPTLSFTRETLERGMPGVLATIERAKDYVQRFGQGA